MTVAMATVEQSVRKRSLGINTKFSLDAKNVSGLRTGQPDLSREGLAGQGRTEWSKSY